MRLGGGSRLPHRMGGGAPDAWSIYEALKRARGTAYSQDDSAATNRELMAMAHAIDRARAFQARGAWQSFAEESTTTMSEWERVLRVTPDPNDTDADRRAALASVERGYAAPTAPDIVDALETAIGEAVQVIAATGRAAPSLGSLGSTAVVPTLTVLTGQGRLTAGDVRVYLGFFDGDDLLAVTQSALVTVADGDAVRVNSFTPDVASTRVEYYFSVASDSDGLSHVFDSDGTARVIVDYPSNPSTGELHYLAIVVTPSTFSDAGKVAKIHRVLGAMLGATTDYSIVTSSPFVLDESLLGEGAL